MTTPEPDATDPAVAPEARDTDPGVTPDMREILVGSVRMLLAARGPLLRLGFLVVMLSLFLLAQAYSRARTAPLADLLDVLVFGLVWSLALAATARVGLAVARAEPAGLVACLRLPPRGLLWGAGLSVLVMAALATSSYLPWRAVASVRGDYYQDTPLQRDQFDRVSPLRRAGLELAAHPGLSLALFLALALTVGARLAVAWPRIVLQGQGPASAWLDSREQWAGLKAVWIVFAATGLGLLAFTGLMSDFMGLGWLMAYNEEAGPRIMTTIPTWGVFFMLAYTGAALTVMAATCNYWNGTGGSGLPPALAWQAPPSDEDSETSS